MNIMNMMKNMQEVKAKQEMRSTDFGKEMDDFCTMAENLVQKADLKQLDQIARLGAEISRIAKTQKARLEDEEDE